ncbi:MAG TPA: BACON domain-containing carbohydrate-binding protein, partial [Chitinophagaceae bacterium]|nr:BACON domain-containing carbohydrate-binding protein [Chitinophagaceae bacterium]
MISKNSMMLDSIDGSNDTLTIISTVQWKATISPAVDWLQLDKTSGTPGNTVMKITLSPANQPINQRTITITFSAIDNSSVQPVNLTI